MTETELKSDFKLITHTPYLALTGELWGVYCEDFRENWLRFNGIRTVPCISKFQSDTKVEILLMKDKNLP